jgi:GDPmannose 4,6-dehydratase
LQDVLYLGNLNARRDWGYAGDFVEAMWLMLQQPEPGDYVVATGEARSVKEFLDEAAEHLGMDWKPFVQNDPRYYRPTEVDVLEGDATKAEQVLNWRPRVRFKELVHMMVDYDLRLAERERLLKDAGFRPESRGLDHG